MDTTGTIVISKGTMIAFACFAAMALLLNAAFNERGDKGSTRQGAWVVIGVVLLIMWMMAGAPGVSN